MKSLQLLNRFSVIFSLFCFFAVSIHELKRHSSCLHWTESVGSLSANVGRSGTSPSRETGVEDASVDTSDCIIISLLSSYLFERQVLRSTD